MNITMKSIKEFNAGLTTLKNKFNFETKESLNKKVSKRNQNEFEKEVNALLSYANELIFITTESNNIYARDLFKLTREMLVTGSKIIFNGGKNEEMKIFLQKQIKKMGDLVYVIKENELEFKPIVNQSSHFFDERWFLEIAKNINIKNEVSIFINELNGGNIALDIKKEITNLNDSDIYLYGIDKDIDCGAESRKKEIETARGGMYECSSYWADISFCANHFLSFEDDWEYYLKSEFLQFYKKKIMRTKGIFVFNYPFYRLDEIKNILKNNELITAINTNDALGNVVFVMRYGITSNQTKKAMKKIEFLTNTLPNSFPESINYISDGRLEVKKFKGKYIDMDDIRVEFKGQEDSAEFLFDYYEPKNSVENMTSPLVEYKPTQIPMVATSEIINGRYVDEVLFNKTQKSFDFDHLFSVKIVKRMVEAREEKVDKDGYDVIEVSDKKSNVIVSVALTADGEYIELFSNETEE